MMNGEGLHTMNVRNLDVRGHEELASSLHTLPFLFFLFFKKNWSRATENGKKRRERRERVKGTGLSVIGCMTKHRALPVLDKTPGPPGNLPPLCSD
jgi:hypothetical protein